MISFLHALEIFQKSIHDWHLQNNKVSNPYEEGTIQFLLFEKNQVDTSQWHKEDEIRRTDIPALAFIQLKREIDHLNQERTNIVEKLDDLFLAYYHHYPVKLNAKLNSETPAWILDRMSILELKIYHMEEQYQRTEILPSQKEANFQKLQILREQREDISTSFMQLIQERLSGDKYFKVYRQMKMYNDPNLNPSLYTNAPKKG
jgi:hypothetical protein